VPRSCIFTRATPRPAGPTSGLAFEPFLARIKQATNAVVNLTSGGSPFMTIEERIKPSIRFKPELASLNMGSMNFGLFPMLNRFKDFKHEWERQYLESTRDLVFRNTFKDIEFALTALSANGTRFEFECYDVGHLYNLAHFAERKLIEPPFLVQHPRRHRHACGRRDAHAAHGRPSLRRRLPLVRIGGWTHANADRRHGRPCARRPGRQFVDR